MIGNIFLSDQVLGVGVGAALGIGSNTASDNQPYTALGPLGKVGRHTLVAIGCLLQAGVHGAHKNAVFQLGKTQVQWGQQVGVAAVGHEFLR